jgi:sugar lactone lactonase YvrE
MKRFTLCAGLFAGLFSLSARAQSVGIGTTAPAASAALEVRSTTQGLLLPRLTSVQRAAIASPAAGLLVFQTDNTPGVYYYDGATWRNMTTGAAPAPNPNQGIVSTLAGSGAFGTADGTGTAAQFNNPSGVACDGSGNVYVADNSSNRIRKIVAATGVVTTLAGSGAFGSADGTGTAASFNTPNSVACDGSGNVYVADLNNQRIRKIVAATGVVTTLAGTGGYLDGTGTAAQFRYPSGVACDGSGNVYVADGGNNRIRKIVAATGIVTTLAGSTSGYLDGTGTAARFDLPQGVACDGSGNVYVADYSNHRIRKIVAATGVVSTLAGSGTVGTADGTGTAAQFWIPNSVACDANGNVYVADYGNNRVRVIVAATGVVSTLAGSTSGYLDGTGPAARFNGPQGVAYDGSGTVYVADYSNNCIRAIK